MAPSISIQRAKSYTIGASNRRLNYLKQAYLIAAPQNMALSSTSSRQAITRHWILNLAREFPEKLASVIPTVRAQYLNVRDIPGLSSADYAAAFLDLFGSGAIEICPIDDDNYSSSSRSHLEEVLEARLKLPPQLETYALRDRPASTALAPRSPDLYWRLTPRGGEEWEALAKPDWNRFVNILTDSDSGEMWCADFDQLMVELGWSRELQSLEIQRATLILERLHDHPITYWKVLPAVHHATFQSMWVERWQGPEPEWLRNWWIARQNWYIEPWQMPDWPKI